jgi:hypothetical protein
MKHELERIRKEAVLIQVIRVLSRYLDRLRKTVETSVKIASAPAEVRADRIADILDKSVQNSDLVSVATWVGFVSNLYKYLKDKLFLRSAGRSPL